MGEKIFSIQIIREVKARYEKKGLEVKCKQLNLFDNLKK